MNKYLQSMERIEYKTLMSEILPSLRPYFFRKDTYKYLIEIFTPDMEDKETFSMSLYEWLEYFINTSLELINDTINFEDNSIEYISQIYKLHEIIIRDILNCLHYLLKEENN